MIGMDAGEPEGVFSCLLSGNRHMPYITASLRCVDQASRSRPGLYEWSYIFPDGQVYVLGRALKTGMTEACRFAAYPHQAYLGLSCTATLFR